MNIDLINIKIIDTDENDRETIVEYTQRRAPQLIYNGGDDRFSTLVASELHFNMLVPDSTDGNFLHLFTGDETRYKVIIEDYSVPETAYTLWTGFLLPEQFGEPWKGGGFFVSFIATDGIGRLKNKTLADTFYNTVTSVSVVFAECLKLTGLTFPIFIAPAIINIATEFTYEDIAVDTTSYVGSKNKNPYDIIDDLLLSMGCKLFQWKEAWYIVGINRLTETSIEFEEYDSDGAYVQQTTVDRTVTPVIFFSSPTISIQPPFQNVTINWEKDQDENILPEDIVYQPIDGPVNWIEFMPIDHWTASTGNFETGLSTYAYFTQLLFVPGTYYYRPDITPVPQENPFYVTLFYTDTGSEDADVNFISLENPIYLEAKAGDEKYVSLELEFYYLSHTDITTEYEAGDYEYAFLYELTYNDITLVSNKSSFDGYEAYNWEFDFRPTYRIHGYLNIEKIPLTSNGTLDLKLSAPLGAVYTDRLVYTKCNITFNSTDEAYEKIRDINYTTKMELDVFHSDDDMVLTNRKWLFTDATTISLDIEIPAVTYEIEILDKVYTIPVTGTGYLKWYISYSDFQLIQANPEYLYALDVYVTPNVFINYLLDGPVGNAPISQDDDGYFIWETYDYTIEDATYLYNDNTIWLMWPSSLTTITDPDYFLEKWRRYEIDENIRYIDALARIYHDTVNEPAYKISGNISGFIGPLEIATFTFITGRSFILTNLTISPDADLTSTRTELVEATKYNVNDYVN